MAELDLRDARIAKLEALLEAALERITHLEEENRQLREENRQLRERLSLNSSNSSKPPSSDAPGTARQPKKPTGRRPGGQPGHKKHERCLLPPEAVQHFVELVPRECNGCRRLRIEPLTPEDTAEYLRVRLARAGCDRELFASDALAMLHEAASGALRDVDRLATAALREAARRKKKLVERDVLARVLDTVGIDEP